MKWIFLAIIVCQLYFLGVEVGGMVNDSRADLLPVRSAKVLAGETVAAWKPTAAFLLNLRMRRIPKDMEPDKFLDWCKAENIRYIFWSLAEAYYYPQLKDGDWMRSKRIWTGKNMILFEVE